MKYLPSKLVLLFLVFIFLLILLLIVKEMSFTGMVSYNQNSSAAVANLQPVGRIVVYNGSISELEIEYEKG
jgi:hypothetical protein